MDQKLQVLLSSISEEWFTPPQYIQAAREVMGTIQLDPASCAEANEIVKAFRYFTKEQDGLKQDWTSSTIFLNPPYGKQNNKSNQSLFANKLIQEYKAGNVEQAILLVNFCGSYKWFEPLYAFPMCVTDHCIRFIRADGKAAGAAKASSTFIYFGHKEELFYRVFSQFGYCGRLQKYNAA